MQYVYCKLAVREVPTLEPVQDLNFRWTLTTFLTPKLSTEQFMALKNDLENSDFAIFGGRFLKKLRCTFLMSGQSCGLVSMSPKSSTEHGTEK